MSRNHQSLRVYSLADDLLVPVYEKTQGFPTEERFGLQSQIRRAAISVPANIVEGCTRSSNKDFVHFLRIALGSASEVEYFVKVSGRLGFMDVESATNLSAKYNELVRSLQSFIQSTESL